MDKDFMSYLSEKTLEQLREKYFDEYSESLQTFRDLPKEIQIRIYFEYWFLSKKLQKSKVVVDTITDERKSIRNEKTRLVSDKIDSAYCIKRMYEYFWFS